MGGIIAVLRWYYGGTMVVLWWYYGGIRGECCDMLQRVAVCVALRRESRDALHSRAIGGVRNGRGTRLSSRADLALPRHGPPRLDKVADKKKQKESVSFVAETEPSG